AALEEGERLESSRLAWAMRMARGARAAAPKTVESMEARRAGEMRIMTMSLPGAGGREMPELREPRGHARRRRQSRPTPRRIPAPQEPAQYTMRIPVGAAKGLVGPS